MRKATGRVADGMWVELGHLFQGHALNAVDAKGRVSVPAPFRALVEKRAVANGLTVENTLMIGEHRNTHCLQALDGLASAEINRRIAASVADLPAAEQMAALDDAARDAFGGYEPVKFDGAGRMVLSAMLRDAGEIGDHAFFVGTGSSFEIWSPARALAQLPETSRVRKPLVFLMTERGLAV